jgi:hypothetical protein
MLTVIVFLFVLNFGQIQPLGFSFCTNFDKKQKFLGSDDSNNNSDDNNVFFFFKK